MSEREQRQLPPTVCVIPGDDAAPEVMRPTVEISANTCT